MRAIIYSRVSTESQVTDGISLDVQESRARSWAEANGASEILSFRDEGISGTKGADQRPGLRDALATVQRGDALIVFSLSRLSRSTRDMLNLADVLQKKNVDLTSLSEKIDTSSAGGRMLFRMLAVLAEFERDLASDRTRAALQFKKANGQKCGGALPPFGYQANKSGKLYADPKEQEAVALVMDRHGKGKSLRNIAQELQAAGYRRKGGGSHWHPQAVARIVERESENRHLSLDA